MQTLRTLSNRGLSASTALAVSLSLLSACADSERPGYVISASTADSSAEVSTLDDGQLDEICESYTAYVDAEISLDVISHTACLALAILSTFTPGTCEETYMACVEGDSLIQIDAGFSGDCRTLRSCDATVGELQGCLNVRTDVLVDIIDRLACGGDVESTDAAEEWMGASTCAGFNDSCTEFTETTTLQ